MKTPKPEVRASATAVRGKYTNLLAHGTNVVLLDADLLESFPDSESVNQALRAFLAINAEVQAARLPKAPARARSTKRTATYDPRKGLSKSALVNKAQPQR